ncbi:hypothetical protein GCM10023148_18310 [Actinokineospora soli]
MASRRAPDDPGPAQAVKVVASVAANVTVATALLYYFGFLYTQRFFSYFRVHYTVLDQSPYEILARGVDGLMMPLAGVTGVALVVLAAVRILRYRLSERAREVLLAVCTPLAAAAGLLLVTVTVYIALEPAPFREYAGLPGLAFAVGILLLILPWQRWSRPKGAPRHSSWETVALWVATYVLVALGLFWAVGDYSQEVAIRRAFETEAGIAARPNTTLYSAGSLSLDGLPHSACGDDATYRFRYTGLKLLLQSGGHYVLVPADWSATTGSAILLPRSDTIRLEFTPANAATTASC